MEDRKTDKMDKTHLVGVICWAIVCMIIGLVGMVLNSIKTMYFSLFFILVVFLYSLLTIHNIFEPTKSESKSPESSESDSQTGTGSNP